MTPPASWEAVMQAEDLSTQRVEPWVSCNPVATHSGLSVKTIRRLKDASLPHRTAGGQLGFRCSQVDACAHRTGRGVRAVGKPTVSGGHTVPSHGASCDLCRGRSAMQWSARIRFHRITRLGAGA
jgi:hypothetical protein